MALAGSEIDEQALWRTLAEVEQATNTPFAVWKAELDDRLAERFACETKALRPWHYEDVFFQSPPTGSSVDLDPYFSRCDLQDLTRNTFEGIGIDITATLGRSDLVPRPDKNQHAFCVDVDRCGDVRVLCNIVPNQEWAETMLHEFGHAAQADGIDRELSWGVRTVHPVITEGVAILFEQLSTNPEWLTSVAGVAHDEVDRIGPELAMAARGRLLTSSRWTMVMTHFERGLYADPDCDHNARWWDLVERFQLIRRPVGRDAPDWATKIHIASAPVYYQNYLLGDLVALQLNDTLLNKFGGLVGRRDAGAFLINEVFRPGASLTWHELIERATGHRLTARHLANAVT